MLKSLHIKNYALIEALDVDLSKGFVVLTGETGAGKSIILGALGLLLGERANISSIGNPEKKCVVEGEFEVKDYKLQELFQQENLDYEELTIIRRELAPSGKSRAFINDTPVNLTVLRNLTSKLIDIHSQHQNLEIENEKFQFQLVDSLAQNSKELTAYQQALKVLKELKKEREELRIAQQQQNTDIDYWKFQLEELQTAQLKSGEQEELEGENAVFSQMENIQYTLSQADSFLNGDHSPIGNLQTIANDFSKLKEVHSSFKELSERLESAYIELSDLAKEINIEAERLENDPERAAYVSERLDTLYRLEQKHGKSSIEELLLLQQELEEKVFNIENFEQLLAALDKKIATQNTVTENYAKQLSESRKKIIPKIEKEVAKQLQFLGMPYAKFSLQLTPSQDFRAIGKEHLTILFSANKNMPLCQIAKVASGGELSRLMLTIKQLMAESLVLPTLIFDEIDTGVSGEIADKMAQIMQKMATRMQVIVISHLPQIAAKAQQHWEVFKQDTTEKTLTNIRELQQAERVAALAKMLSGSNLTEEAMANAKVLLRKS